MSTSPIVAAASPPTLLPSPGGAGRSSENSSGFHQVLRQTSLGNETSSIATASPFNSSGNALPGDSGAIKKKASRTGVLDALEAKHEPLEAANVFTGKKKQRGKVAGKAVSVAAKDGSEKEEKNKPLDLTAVTAPLLATPKAASEISSDSLGERTSTTASASSDLSSLPALDLLCITPASVASSLINPLNSAIASDSATAHTGKIAAAAASDVAEGIPTANIESPAVIGNHLITVTGAGRPAREVNGLNPYRNGQDVPSTSAAGAAGRAPLPTAPAKSRAKPQTPISPSEGGGAAQSADVSFNATAPMSTTSQSSTFQASIPPEHLVNDQSGVALPVGDSLPRQAPTGLVRPQLNSMHEDTSSSVEKISSAGTTGDHDSSIPLASVLSAHTISFQPALVQPTIPSAQAASGDGTTSTTAMLPRQSQSPAPTSVHAEAQLQSHPIPDPPRMVDSGQLHVSVNKSELKVSVQLPDLGTIEVRAVTTHDVTTAHLTASSHEALQVLAADRTGLEQALKSRDVILGSLDSHTQDSHTQGESAGQQRQQNFQSPAQLSGSTSSIVAEPTAFATVEAIPVGLDRSSINVRA